MISKVETAIIAYIRKHPEDSTDLWTLVHEIGPDSFLNLMRRAGKRRIVVFSDDRTLCDPPIKWKFKK